MFLGTYRKQPILEYLNNHIHPLNKLREPLKAYPDRYTTYLYLEVCYM